MNEIKEINGIIKTKGMNERSSRSHTVFMVKVNQTDGIRGGIKTGRLYLVDPEGSERVGQTGAEGQTLEEANKINQSLSALGNVINALTDPKVKHIPYRDSKLTRILQETFGGNSRTVLIICCSASSTNAKESLSTLRFGQRAKAVKNTVKQNLELSRTELKRLLAIAQKEIETLKKQNSDLETEIAFYKSGGAPLASGKKAKGKGKGKEGEDEEKESEKGKEKGEGNEALAAAYSALRVRCKELEDGIIEMEEVKKKLEEEKLLNSNLLDDLEMLKNQKDDVNILKDKFEITMKEKTEAKKKQMEIEIENERILT